MGEGETEAMTPPVPAETGGRPRWTRLAILGLLMEAMTPILFLIAVLAFGLEVGEEIVFIFVVPVIPLIGAFLVWRFGTWARFVGIVAALVPAFLMFWTAFSITLISSFFDFVPAILLIPGFLIAVVSLIASLIAGRRGHRTSTASGGERLALRIILGVVVLLAVVSGVMTLLGKSSTTEAASADVTVGTKSTKFDPRNFAVSSGDTILVLGNDPFAHTFTIDALEIDETTTPGVDVTVKVPDRPGTYIVYCKFHTSDPKKPEKGDMAGRVTIR